MHVLQDDVIAAIATPSGVGGVGIVRISGKNAIAVADRVYRFIMVIVAMRRVSGSTRCWCRS